MVCVTCCFNRPATTLFYTYCHPLALHCSLPISPSSTEGKSMSTTPRVKLQTNQGDITIVLDAEKAPKTVESFLTYVKEGFYDGTIFHRVINNFMIQGGGFDADMKQDRKSTRLNSSH